MIETLDSATRRRTPTPAALDPVIRFEPAPRASWLRRHRVGVPIVLALLALTAWLIGTGIEHYPAFADDEGTYVAQAWAVTAKGTLSHYTYWYDHPPLGWLQLAFVTWLLGPLLHGTSAVATARSLMLIPAFADAGLLYVLARRLGLRRETSVLAVVLFVASPLSVTMLRQVYLDTIALPWLLASFVLASSPSKRLWACAGSGACLAISVLSKETMLLFGPAVALLLVQSLDRRTRSFCLTAFLASFLLIGVGYPLYAALKGELFPGPGHVSLLTAVGFQLWGRPGTGSVLQAHSPVRQLLAGWENTDPWILLLGVIATPCALAIRRLRPIGVAIAIGVVAVIRGGYLPQPFVIALLPLLALAVAGAADAAWGWAAARPDARSRTRAIVAITAPLVVLAVLIGPAWGQGDETAMTRSSTGPELSAQHWIERHVSRRARLLIDDTMYVDLVKAGFRPQFGVVWFYKMDFTTNLDPEIVRHLPRGWRSFDYVISSPVIRSALSQQPGTSYQQVRLALQHSRVVASFGSGISKVQVRRLYGPGVGSGLIRQAATYGAAR